MWLTFPRNSLSNRLRNSIMPFPILLALSVAIQDPPANREVLAFSSRGIEALLVDFKDQGLRDLVRLIEPRLAELSVELAGQTEVPPSAVRLLGRALLDPIRFGIVLPSNEGSGVPLLLRLELSAESGAAARSVAGDFAELLGASGLQAELPEAGGLAEIQGSPIPAWIGSQGERFVLAVGSDDAGAFSSAQPSGADAPAYSLTIDYGQLMQQMMAMAGGPPEEQRAAFSMLERLGYMDLRLSMRSRVDDDCTRTITSMAGFGKNMRESGIIPEQPLPMSALAAVPEDALWAQVFSFDVGAYLDFVMDAFEEQLASSGVEDPIEMLDQMSGFHLQHDFCDHLGSSFGLYASDTTGASGCGSIVMFAALTDGAALAETIERLEDVITGLAASEAQGRIAVRSWKSGETSFSTLTFPGLPVPLEPTWAIAAEYFILAATPQAALAAVRQVQHPETSLEHNPRLVEQLPAERGGLQAIMFVDTPRLLRSGYAPMSFVCSALANATRSPTDASRDAGIVLPPYGELMRGARAFVSVSRIQGEDLVQEMQADRSLAVNLTGLAGFLVEGPLLQIAALAGISSAWSGGAMSTLMPVPPPDAPEAGDTDETDEGR